MDGIKIVIGSWGSYNECNERALGSRWLDLSEYTTWDEIADELKNEGFVLDGIDEELFIQDIESICDGSVNWEVRDFDEFERRVNNRGEHWDEDINLWQNYDWYDYGREIMDCCGEKLPEHLEDFFDFEQYGRYCGADYVYEYSNGLIEIQ